MVSLLQAKLAGLEDQVAELSERLRAVELEKARYKAERDALSQRVDTLQSSGARLPTPDPLVRSRGSCAVPLDHQKPLLCEATEAEEAPAHAWDGMDVPTCLPDGQPSCTDGLHLLHSAGHDAT
jgi:hypothetical protein